MADGDASSTARTRLDVVDRLNAELSQAEALAAAIAGNGAFAFSELSAATIANYFAAIEARIAAAKAAAGQLHQLAQGGH